MPKGCKKCGFSQEQQNPQTTTENPQNATIKSATVAPNIDNDIDTKIDTTITAPTSGAGNEVNKLIDLFKDVNPSWERLFARKGERQAIERLIAKHGKEKVGQMISALPRIIGRKYAPRITTPYQLESKLGDLVAYLEQQKDIHSPIITIS